MEKRIEILWRIWGVSMGVLTLFGFICVYFLPESMDPAPLEQGSIYQYILMGSVAFYFGPILLRIQYLSRKVGMKESKIASILLLALKLIWLICAAVSLF